jgi:PAS domain S-box-containing protein
MRNTFATEIILPNEHERLKALHRYRILGTEAEKSFVGIAKLVAEIFNFSIAMISLVDSEEVYYASNVGLNETASPRGSSLCSLTVLASEVNVIENTLLDPLVAESENVCGEFGLRFYAGAPLITPDGFRIGTVCIADTVPRQFSSHERSILKDMAGLVMEQIELRLQNMINADHQHDINQRLVESNHRLKTSEARFQSILDTMAEGVGIIDLNGNIIYANNMAQRILRLSHNQINKRKYNDPSWQNLRLDGTPLPDEEHPMAIMMQTSEPVLDHEIGLKLPDGEVLYVSINAAPLFDTETGELSGGIGTFMDVTNRRRILQQKDEFINVASHELRTPVTSLKAAMQVLDRIKENPKPEVLYKMIDQSNRSLDRLTRLINDLLDSNRISQGKLHLRKTRFNLSKILGNCYNHIPDSGRHELVFSGLTNAEIEADEQQIEQVFYSLINNAVKYGPESKKISILTENLGSEIKVSIRDNGPGIPVDQLSLLFERYYRVDYSGIQLSGLGLGLYISSEIIKKHGGRVGVESVFGEGATFWFTLPTL